jgi:hypothetical protein
LQIGSGGVVVEFRMIEQYHFINTGLQPGDSRRRMPNRFNGFSPCRQAVETARPPDRFTTRLKPGVNESLVFACFYESQ